MQVSAGTLKGNNVDITVTGTLNFFVRLRILQSHMSTRRIGCYYLADGEYDSP